MSSINVACESGELQVLSAAEVERVLLAADAAAEDARLLEGLLCNAPVAWREFGVRYDRLIFRCISKVTRRFGSRVTSDDVREIHGQLILSLLANDKHKLKSF